MIIFSIIFTLNSRFAYTAPLKTKTAQETAKALDTIFTNLQFLPTFLVVDSGGEFGILCLCLILAKK